MGGATRRCFQSFRTVNVMKVHLLLHYVGQSTYNTICDKLAPVKANSKTYSELVGILQTHFDPKPLEIVENYRFHMRKQQDGESAEDFIVALRKLAINCNFGAYLDTALRNQFAFGVRNAINPKSTTWNGWPYTGKSSQKGIIDGVIGTWRSRNS